MGVIVAWRGRVIFRAHGEGPVVGGRRGLRWVLWSGRSAQRGGGSGVAAVDLVAEPVGVVAVILGHRLAAPVVTDVDQPEAGVALLVESFGGHVGEVFG